MNWKRFLAVFTSPRFMLSIATLAVLGLIIYLSRGELVQAWHLLKQANIWILLLLIPFQMIVYYAGGEMIFAYLRDKKLIHHISHFEQTRIALELNLVNHIFPSGGVSGISYTTWRLHKLGVSSSRSTFAQLVRYVMGFVSFIALLLVSVFLLILDGTINRYIVGASFLLVVVILGGASLLSWMFTSHSRMHRAAQKITHILNAMARFFTFGKIKRWLHINRVEDFFAELHKDFQELSMEKRLLIKPFIWGIVYAMFDMGMFMVTFWSLGVEVNPAILMVGYGVAALAGLVAFTPGGAGVYEAIMILFLSMAGVAPDEAIAGIILTRTILLAGTIIFGYIFYQQALMKYGKHHDAAL